MRILKTNTAVRIVVGPFLDATDGVTPETALTVTNCTCELFHEHDDGSAPTRSALTLSASGGSNDMVHITNDVGGYYDLELAASDVNFLGRARLSIIDTDVHLPVFEEILVVAANVYDALMGTDYLKTDAVEVNGTAQTGRDLGASVLLAADQAVNVTKWNGDAVAVPTVAGVPQVDATYIGGYGQTPGTDVAGNASVAARYAQIAAHLGAIGAGKGLATLSQADPAMTPTVTVVSGTWPTGKTLRVQAVNLDPQESTNGTSPRRIVMGRFSEAGVWTVDAGWEVTLGDSDILYLQWDAGGDDVVGELVLDMVWPIHGGQTYRIRILPGTLCCYARVDGRAQFYDGGEYPSQYVVATGPGAISCTITVNSGGNPVDGAEVWITTDSAGTNTIAGTLYTNTLGLVTFMLDPGTYYVWAQRSGVNITNPSTLTVV